MRARFGEAVAPPDPTSGDPFAMFSGWDTGDLALLAFLISAAAGVFWYGSRRLAKERGGASLRPQGRVFVDRGTRHFGPQWRAIATKLEERDASPLNAAKAGVVRVVGTIVKSSGSLGGDPERACVWRNRAGAKPDSAVGAEIVVLADATGHCGVENLERARVTAPAEKQGVHYEWYSLYVGDRVEVLGTFEPEAVPEASDDATQDVYGSIGGRGPLEIRLVERPAVADEVGVSKGADATDDDARSEQVDDA